MTAFEQAVREALKPIAGTFAFEAMVRNHLDEEKYKPWAALINSWKPLQGCAVLSSGCGSGNDFPAYFELGATRVCGVEVEQELVDLAHKRFQGTPREAQVEVQLYDGRALPYPDRSFDVVTSIHVVEHVQDMPFYMHEIFRVLKPGGLLFMDFPNRFYQVEQHTGLHYVHLMPHWMGQALVRLLLRHGLRFQRYKHIELKLKALVGYRPPYAGDVIRVSRRAAAAYGVRVDLAGFHNYDDAFIPYQGWWRQRRKIFHEMSTVRVVIRRAGG